jgi:hypothetical protein
MHPSLHSHVGGKFLEFEEVHSPLRRLRSMLPLETNRHRRCRAHAPYRGQYDGYSSVSSGQSLCEEASAWAKQQLEDDDEAHQQQQNQPKPPRRNGRGRGETASDDSTFVDSEVEVHVLSECDDHSTTTTTANTTRRDTLKTRCSDDQLARNVRLSRERITRNQLFIIGDELHDRIAGTLFFSTLMPCYHKCHQ